VKEENEGLFAIAKAINRLADALEKMREESVVVQFHEDGLSLSFLDGVVRVVESEEPYP
jgi:hypothetical protein